MQEAAELHFRLNDKHPKQKLHPVVQIHNCRGKFVYGHIRAQKVDVQATPSLFPLIDHHEILKDAYIRYFRDVRRELLGQDDQVKPHSDLELNPKPDSDPKLNPKPDSDPKLNPKPNPDPGLDPLPT